MKACWILSALALALAAVGSAQAQVTVFNADNGLSINTLIRDARAGLTITKVAGFSATQEANFNWDPDSAINASYGATASDLTGMKITTETSDASYSGVYGAMTSNDQRGYSATLTETETETATVPVPWSYALMALGLVGMGFFAQRRQDA